MPMAGRVGGGSDKKALADLHGGEEINTAEEDCLGAASEEVRSGQRSAAVCARRVCAYPRRSGRHRTNSALRLMRGRSTLKRAVSFNCNNNMLRFGCRYIGNEGKTSEV